MTERKSLIDSFGHYRPVDDLFCVTAGSGDFSCVHVRFNGAHETTRFAVEREMNNHLHFLSESLIRLEDSRIQRKAKLVLRLPELEVCTCKNAIRSNNLFESAPPN